MKTHKVIDLVYEGEGVFAGTEQECQDFVASQGGVGYEIVTMTREEIEQENRP